MRVSVPTNNIENVKNAPKKCTCGLTKKSDGTCDGSHNKRETNE